MFLWHLVEISGEIAVYAYGNDVSEEILADLVRKDVAEFSDRFSYFHYATLEMFKGAFNNYSMLKLRSFNQNPHFYNVF